MASAKKCDLCGSLYESNADHDYTGYGEICRGRRRDLQSRIQIRDKEGINNDRSQHESLEVCKDCIQLGIRRLMAHLDIR